MGGPRVVLIGPPGSGKSSVGTRLAQLLGVEWRDTDHDVEKSAGKSIADIFIDDGEERFREQEAHAVAHALSEHTGVLSLGGGAIMDPRTEERLVSYVAAGGEVVFLDVSLSKAAPRVGLNAARPLLAGNPRQRWLELMEARRPVYERIATRVVMTDGLTPAAVAATIAEGEGS
ncbi:shikimate kinase [Demequina zhanjiangensis]|uniref:Shikimate kinase n=1 Tax=Demequina zhanjiangensis TaxID=3051659 RepID=A0ABT8G2I0_9MICO|nr:shikimate kinase [Demequina sp. SYSU T00b26]MDN4473346.1 shikimate kinase [Demequina sp. SYSU T00b26]